MTSNDKTETEGQRVIQFEIFPGRQDLSPFVLTFGCSENEREEEQYDFIEGEYILRED